MTFEPQRLSSPSTPLVTEVESAKLLLSRLATLATATAHEPALEDQKSDKGGPGASLFKRAEQVVEGYMTWLSDTESEFDVDGVRGEDEGGEVGRREEAEMTAAERERDREMLDIIEEVIFRQRYIANQLALLKLRPRKDKAGPISKGGSSNKTRISKLQSYNEIKDAAQEIMGLVAENRGVTVGTMYESGEFGVSGKD
ncbi:uncharacterized protein DNG_01750 [Cephalotrichum gorgonifer]|uniref:Uncharacterized protein n=1 Tax=Cephalotrichum gorgonifer TaxID=2041049 RepID=A0AAE8SRX2_9PEZI|nr:uncharacterized protein DNG_01750 [Cephalotrichum gorgonifer]